MSLKEIRWGVIGAGDVVERKSGLPLTRAPGSRWVALTRRNVEAARKIALRFGVPEVYGNTDELLADKNVNAVYIATPPSSHAELAVRALEAGKAVYLEKPMARNAREARDIVSAVERTGGKLVVAHYRRAQPAFRKVKELLDGGAIGKTLFVRVLLLQSADSSITSAAEPSWRLDPKVSGGGLFHDLSPHQIDLLYHWFGPVAASSGYSGTLTDIQFPDTGGLSDNPAGPDIGRQWPADYVTGRISFENGVQADGTWCFCVDSPEREIEECVIYGSRGRISFPFFGSDVKLENREGHSTIPFSPPEWVQEPMIQSTVRYFLDEGENPCSAAEGLETMKIIDSFS